MRTTTGVILVSRKFVQVNHNKRLFMFILAGIEVLDESLIGPTNGCCSGPGEGIQFAYEAPIKEVFSNINQGQIY